MIEQFLQYLHLEKRYSDNTISSYRNDLKNFSDFFSIGSNFDWGTLTFKDVRQWMVSLSENGLTEKTINRKLSSVRSLFKYLKKKQKVAVNPAQLVTGPKIRKKLPTYVPEKDLKKVFEENKISPNDTYDEALEKIIIELLYQSGMRLSELINLKEDGIFFDQIKVLGKRNKERLIPISAQLSDQIAVFLTIRNQSLVETDGSHLLLTKKGKKLYPKLVYRKVNNYIAEVSNVDKKSPHVLRHTFATHMLNNGASLEMIKEILGHSNLVATQVYTHNSLSKLKQVYNQAHPRGGTKKM